MAGDYPKRPKFFAHRVVRLAFKTCLAQELGPTATMLVIFVAHTEDAKHYSAPPTFYNSQLLPVLGIQKWDTLDRARRDAVAAGWLHYEAPPKGSRRHPGTYWCDIPKRFLDLDDQPSDEHTDDTHQTDTVSRKAYPRNGYGSGDGMVYGAGDRSGDGSGDGMGELPTRTRTRHPDPLPPKSPKGDLAGKLRYCVLFDQWWSIYPRREGKAKAYDAWKKAGKAIKADRGLTSAEAAAFLIERVTVYAASPRATKSDPSKIPHAATWLNQGRYDDDDAAWLVPLTDRHAEAQNNGELTLADFDFGDGK